MPLFDRQVAQAVVLATGVVIGGALIGNGFARGDRDDRYVTVKGISEREAKADLAIWPLHIGAADNDLGRAHDRLVTSAHAVLLFLARNALDTTAATVQDLSVTDEFLEGGSDKPPPARYAIRETIVLRSTKPDLVAAASQHVAELVGAGVVLSSAGEPGSGGPTFVYTGLNTLKPQMIAEATARAREAAE